MKEKFFAIAIMSLLAVCFANAPTFADDSTTREAADGGPEGQPSTGTSLGAPSDPAAVPLQSASSERMAHEGAETFDGAMPKELSSAPVFPGDQKYQPSPELALLAAQRRQEWPRPTPSEIHEIAEPNKPHGWKYWADLSAMAALPVGGALGLGLWKGAAWAAALGLAGPWGYLGLAAAAALGGLIGFGIYKMIHMLLYPTGERRGLIREKGLQWLIGSAMGAVAGGVAVWATGTVFWPLGLAMVGAGLLGGFLLGNAYKGEKAKSS
ncbi:MAG: hypothetical protein HY547_01725 [Elusimicrobia bacterium]|nr:hypothetical protein [Elusimicrobiota bacterium]